MSETKTKKSKEQIIEILTAVFLGITALATAWASWIVISRIVLFSRRWSCSIVIVQN